MIKINSDVFYIKPDRINGYYYLGSAPVVYVVKDGEMFNKGIFKQNDIESLCVFIKEDDNGKKNYMLSLKKGEFTTSMENYITGMLLITSEKQINGVLI